MGKDFWLNRWNQNEIGWHQTEVEPALIEWATHLKPGRILVPLCGKSLDMVWLRDQGFKVVGVELSAIACETFFRENNIAFTQKVHGEHVHFEGEGILLINGSGAALLIGGELGKEIASRLFLFSEFLGNVFAELLF